MSEEFKPIRITLSDEAFSRMEMIMKNASFRSYSSTIEECIRAVHDLIDEINAIGGTRGDPPRNPMLEDRADSWDRILMRMYRFTGRRVGPRKE